MHQTENRAKQTINCEFDFKMQASRKVFIEYFFFMLQMCFLKKEHCISNDFCALSFVYKHNKLALLCFDTFYTFLNYEILSEQEMLKRHLRR